MAVSVRVARRFGRYELLTELGRGGMAELHLARLSGIGGFTKLVAIKLMLPHLSQNKHFHDMFINEGRIAARISHPNVCQVFEIGDEAGQLFLAMEYLEGVTWEELMRVLPEDPITRLRVATGVLAQACEGLHHAHDLRDPSGTPSPVIHRDISPQNLFITVDGVCKVLDFGVAKVVNDVSNTRSGVLKGKLPYMSPEQIRGEELDTRSDVFATGIVLWESLANRPLFMREVEFAIWKAILEDKIDPVSMWEPAYGADVDAFVMKALERDRDNRYPSMRDFADALRQLGDTWGGALTATEIGELVRKRCSDKLMARQLEIQTIETVPDEPDNAWRSEQTVTTEAAQLASVVLRADSLALGRKPKPKWPLAVGGLVAFGVSLAISFFVMHRDAPASETTAAPAVAPADAPQVVAAIEVDAAVEPVVEPAKPAVAPEPVPEPEPEKPTKPVKPVKQRKPPKPDRRVVPDPEPVEAAVKLDPGMLSVDVKPSARVYVDGRFVDDTPLFRHKLAAGKHEVRLVPPQGPAWKRVIKIEPGKTLNLGTVAW